MMTARGWFAGLLTLAAAWGCAPPSPPSIVLVTLDTTRADHCSTYGYGVQTTPALSELSDKGVRFDAAYAPMATTGPSHASLFTGLHPRAHGFIKNGLELDEELTTVVERLDREGYRTAAFISAFPVSSRFGFDQGFDEFDESFLNRVDRPRNWEGVRMESEFERDADETSALAVKWLSGLDPEGSSFFLWVHFFDAHHPYAPRAGNPLVQDAGKGASEDVVALYDAEVWQADQGLDRIIDALEESGWSDRTAVIVVGDHGEGLMDHGHLGHGLHLYEEAVRVPLVIRPPGSTVGGSVAGDPVEVADLAVTMMELAGLNPSCPGVSLVPALRGMGVAGAQRTVFFQRRFYLSGMVKGFEVAGVKTGLRQGSWKYIVAPEEGTVELYDLAGDPGEKENVAADYPDLRRDLDQLVDEWYERVPQKRVALADLEVDEFDAAALRALGYVD